MRIYNSGKEGGEPCKVLTGHKNKYPVFDIDWNSDGRALLSAGGDGSVRLWDTSISGASGDMLTRKTNTKNQSLSRGADKKKASKTNQITNNIHIPGSNRGESIASNNGPSIAVYKGHVPNSPVWSVSFAPSGNYFFSAGADATARLWTTDRPLPVRLFSGHTSANANCVGWHPNANYIITGSDDKTARLWDIQTGQTVRILTGSGINVVQIPPGGRYCAGADYSGLVHLWDLGSGKNMSFYRPVNTNTTVREQILHSLSFSACGDALAVGSDDCCIRQQNTEKSDIEICGNGLG